MDKNKKQAFHLRELEKSFPYAQAVKVGKTLYLSGSVSWDQDGQVVAAGDMKAQMRNAYEDIRKTLDAHGATFENIVKETLYTTDIDAAVEALVNMKAGKEAGEKLYIANRRTERDLSTLFLVDLSMSTDGGSQMLDSTLQINSIPVGSTVNLNFAVKADSVENLSGEKFTVRIDSAISAVSQSDAIIKTSADSTALVYIEKPAQAQLELVLSDPDNILTAGDDFDVTVNLINKGGILPDEVPRPNIGEGRWDCYINAKSSR